MARTAFDTLSASSTLFRIDMGQKIGYRYSAMATGTATFATPNATDVAVFHRKRATVTVVAGHCYGPYSVGNGPEFDYPPWTTLYAKTACGTFIGVHLRLMLSFRDSYGAKHAASYTVASSQASENAFGLSLI